jgi:hypothetical protein
VCGRSKWSGATNSMMPRGILRYFFAGGEKLYTSRSLVFQGPEDTNKPPRETPTNSHSVHESREESGPMLGFRRD